MHLVDSSLSSMVRHWNREVMESLSLEVVKKCGDVALVDMVEMELDLVIFEVFS